MAFQSAPTNTANAANQNDAQPFSTIKPAPPSRVFNFQAAPQAQAVLQPRPAAAAIG